MGLGLSVNPSWSVSTRGTTFQCSGQALLDILLAHPPNRRWTHIQSLTDLLIDPTWPIWAGIGLQQNPSMQEFSCCGFPRGNQVMKRSSFLCGKLHDIFLIHLSLLELFCHPRIQQGLPTSQILAVSPLE